MITSEIKNSKSKLELYQVFLPNTSNSTPRQTNQALEVVGNKKACCKKLGNNKNFVIVQI